MKVLLWKKLRRTWFFIWFLGISTYLLIKAIRRYIEFKTFQFESVIDKEIDNGIITMYLTSIVMGIAAAICCAICIIFKTGNYANDLMKFGKQSLDFKSMRLQLHNELIGNQTIQPNRQLSPRFRKRIKNHFPAFFSCFYFLTSLCFVIVLPYLESEKIRLDMEPQNRIWHTNLDVIFNTYTHFEKVPYTKNVTPEFFNLVISLIVHAFSYANVFWRFSKLFSFLFTIVIFINGLVFILDLALVEMLIKLGRNSHLVSQALKLEFQWIPYLSILSFISYLFMLVLQLSLFEYGFNRVKDALIRRPSSELNDNCTTYNNSSNISLKLRYVWKKSCIESWNGIMLPFVIGMISTVFSILVKLPYIYKSMSIIYSQTNMNLVLINVVASLLYLFSMVVLWVCLILKSNWSIKNYVDPVPISNGDCAVYIPNHNNNEIPPIPVYASVNRQLSTSPLMDQEPHFPIFYDKMATQWRYSCSPPSLAPNDSNSNSDATGSAKNQDMGSHKKNYIYLSRINPNCDPSNLRDGIYSQLVKLTPQLGLTDNPMQSDSGVVQLATDLSDNSSNQTVHIIGPSPMDLSRRSLDQGSFRNRGDQKSEISGPEYFNIITTNPRLMYDHAVSSNADTESNNLCTQV